MTDAYISEIIKGNAISQEVANYFHGSLFDDVFGKNMIEVKWSDIMHEQALGLKWETKTESNQVMKYHIEICHRAVRPKELIYHVILHEIAHCSTTATNKFEHKYHGNAYLKTLEIFYQWDSRADFYQPSRHAGCQMPYLYRCQDFLCGKTYERKKPITRCACNEGIDCLRYEGNDVEVKPPGHDYEQSEETESSEEGECSTLEENLEH